MNSDSESDNEAPEEVTLTTAKRTTKQQLKSVKDADLKTAAARKQKASEADAKLKKVKAAGKAKEEAEAKAALEAAEAEIEDEGDVEEQQDDEVDEEEDVPATASSSTYLDPALFASTAAFYEPEKPAAAGKGKHAMKRRVRAEKMARSALARERALSVGEGGSRDVGNLTVQHLPRNSHTHASLASTSLPSHTSATKFLTQRLYSKKRVIAVLDAAQPRPQSDDSHKRRKKVGGGMSAESKMLLGMGMDDGGRDKASKESAADREKGRKRSLLLQSEGRRKSASMTRPLSSTKGRATPAANFAVSTRTS